MDLTAQWYNPEAEKLCSRCGSKRRVSFDVSDKPVNVVEDSSCLDCGLLRMAFRQVPALEIGYEYPDTSA